MFKNAIEIIISILAAIYLFASSTYNWIKENTDKEDWAVIIGTLILGNLFMFLVGCVMCILKP